MSEALKPCPFCGPGNSIVELYQSDFFHEKWQVGCGRCGSHSGLHKEADACVAAWNRRAPTSVSEATQELHHESCGKVEVGLCTCGVTRQARGGETV